MIASCLQPDPSQRPFLDDVMKEARGLVAST
ncbi:hypothetical protein VYU27_009340 [Nannochloropsis oceanica]